MNCKLNLQLSHACNISKHIKTYVAVPTTEYAKHNKCSLRMGESNKYTSTTHLFYPDGNNHCTTEVSYTMYAVPIFLFT